MNALNGIWGMLWGNYKRGMYIRKYVDTDLSAGFQMTFRGNRLIVKNDLSICMNSGYCKLRDTNLFKIIAAADNADPGDPVQLRSFEKQTTVRWEPPVRMITCSIIPLHSCIDKEM